MTSTIAATRGPTEHADGADGISRRRVPVSVVALIGATALAYLWGLGASGWANGFYAAAVQAGSRSWQAMLFGSSDAANAITVDKPPAALWVMDLSARLFGFNSWSLLAPQAVAGTAAVGLLYATVRRAAGHKAGLLAGVVLASTPVAALMFRFDNPDALLVLLLVAAAYCVMRSIAPGAAWWWLPSAGVAVGFGFLTKMLQAFLVLPAFALVYLVAAAVPAGCRIRRSVGAVGAVVVSAGWYVALVEIWPADSRPYIGGSQHNSILELTLGYNGLGRLTGNEIGGHGNMNVDAGAGRLFADLMGAQISWLLPAAVALIVAGLWIGRRAPRTDAVRAQLMLWGGWLVITGATFSFANGILHPYYTVALAPAIAGGVGIGAAQLWQVRDRLPVAVAAAVVTLGTAIWAWALLSRTADWLPWLRVTIVVGGVVAAAALIVMSRRTSTFPAVAAAGLAIVVCLAGPTAYAIATVVTPHGGAIPSAGPAGTSRFGRPGDGRHPPESRHPVAAARHAVPRGRLIQPRRERNAFLADDGPPPGLFGVEKPPAALTSLLVRAADRYTWVAATVGSDKAASYQLASGAPVMAVGGYNGTDPAPTLEQFRRDVAQHRIHWFIGGEAWGPFDGVTPSGSREPALIVAWVAANFAVHTIDGVPTYDLTAGAPRSRS